MQIIYYSNYDKINTYIFTFKPFTVSTCLHQLNNAVSITSWIGLYCISNLKIRSLSDFFSVVFNIDSIKCLIVFSLLLFWSLLLDVEVEVVWVGNSILSFSTPSKGGKSGPLVVIPHVGLVLKDYRQIVKRFSFLIFT